MAVSLLLSGWMGTQLVNRLRLAYHLTDWQLAHWLMGQDLCTYQLMNQITKKLLGISMALVRKKFR